MKQIKRWAAFVMTWMVLLTTGYSDVFAVSLTTEITEQTESTEPADTEQNEDTEAVDADQNEDTKVADADQSEVTKTADAEQGEAAGAVDADQTRKQPLQRNPQQKSIIWLSNLRWSRHRAHSESC